MSDITAEAVSVDAFALSQTDNAGGTTTATRSYTANGMTLTQTDGRGNTTTTVTDKAGRTLTVTDAAGVRTISYNAYGEPESDSLVADSVTHFITETRDDKGRSTGYTYAKNGTVQQTVTTGYGSDGRISSAGFQHGGAPKYKKEKRAQRPIARRIKIWCCKHTHKQLQNSRNRDVHLK